MTDTTVKVIYPDKIMKIVPIIRSLPESEYFVLAGDYYCNETLKMETRLIDSTTRRAVNSIIAGQTIYPIYRLKDLRILEERLSTKIGPLVFWDYYNYDMPRKRYGIPGNIKNLIEV